MNKTAYLTIDDAPSKQLNQKVDILRRLGIPAVLFCQGNLLEQHPEQALYALEHGFILGNHSYDHPHFSDLALKEGYEQIRRTDALLGQIYAAAGVPWGKDARPGKYFRFPYGDKGGLRYSEVLAAYSDAGAERKNALQTYLRQLGYCQPPFAGVTYRYYHQAGLLTDIEWRWTYDVMEWSINAAEHLCGVDSIERVFARMDEDAPESGQGLHFAGSEEIVLTHDHTNTGEFFEPILKRLLAKGLTFKLPG